MHGSWWSKAIILEPPPTAAQGVKETKEGNLCVKLLISAPAGISAMWQIQESKLLRLRLNLITPAALDNLNLTKREPSWQLQCSASSYGLLCILPPVTGRHRGWHRSSNLHNNVLHVARCLGANVNGICRPLLAWLLPHDQGISYLSIAGPTMRSALPADQQTGTQNGRCSGRSI